MVCAKKMNPLTAKIRIAINIRILVSTRTSSLGSHVIHSSYLQSDETELPKIQSTGRLLPKINEIKKRARKMTNNILANSIAKPATPTKPRNPATSASTKKNKAQYSMFRSPFITNFSDDFCSTSVKRLTTMKI